MLEWPDATSGGPVQREFQTKRQSSGVLRAGGHVWLPEVQIQQMCSILPGQSGVYMSSVLRAPSSGRKAKWRKDTVAGNLGHLAVVGGVLDLDTGSALGS